MAPPSSQIKSHLQSGSSSSPSGLLKGRGSQSNPPGRFAPHIILRDTEYSDGTISFYESEIHESIATSVSPEKAASIISKNKSPDVPFEQSINPYKGCEHGCVYCFARPSHAYLELSPGLDFETTLLYKENAVALLEQSLKNPRYRCKPIALGVNTDAYQPIEKQLEITRDILKTLQKYRHPVSIITKSSLILRDIDILEEMARHQLCSVMVSMTTLDNSLKVIMEPRAASANARLKTISELHQRGIPTGVLLAPMIPKINDQELEDLLQASYKAGARSAAWILIRLPHEVKDLFSEWLFTHYPRRAEHVLSLIRQCHQGQLYDSSFSHRMQGSGHFAQLMEQRFQLALKRFGFSPQMKSSLNCKLFSRPDAETTATRQLSLFD
ncbi:MAG: PA0069 family radical SAM protein [Hahellaceae bacterium]|nr:PA0069 family radical SAM protein [Hahellaceae bacterium]